MYLLKTRKVSLSTKLPQTSLMPIPAMLWPSRSGLVNVPPYFRSTLESPFGPSAGVKSPHYDFPDHPSYALPKANTGFLQAMSSPMAGAWLKAEAMLLMDWWFWTESYKPSTLTCERLTYTICNVAVEWPLAPESTDQILPCPWFPVKSKAVRSCFLCLSFFIWVSKMTSQNVTAKQTKPSEIPKIRDIQFGITFI